MKNRLVVLIAAFFGLFCVPGVNAQEAEKTRLPADGLLITETVGISSAAPSGKTVFRTAELEETTESDGDPLLPLPSSQTAANGGYVRPDKKIRLKRYIKRTVGPLSLARQAARAGFTTLTNSPEEWERTGEGFARRFGSNLGSNAIKQTTIYGLDEVLKLDSSYYRSPKKDFGSKMKNALLSTVTARNKEGKRVFGAPRIAGTYTASIIAREAWYPDRYDYKDGLRSGTISLGFNAAFNVFKEFFLK